ncbi:MAG TPA: HEPN domain-containing protein [Pyrinomonadaceae bacterium]|nr:HEPN domain-containing protein [Pyrinomonadaceae bacterium]
MPSKSFANFLIHLDDVTKLTEAHNLFSRGTRGRKQLGYITRSGIVMLSAAWERYNEDLLLECIKFIAHNISDATVLPEDIRRTLSHRIKNDKHELKPIELTGNGWKKVWFDYAQEKVLNLHNPKSVELDKLFKEYLGLDNPNYSKLWLKNSVLKVDKFIETRGAVAHRGRDIDYVRFNFLQQQIELIRLNTIQIDSEIANYLQNLTKVAHTPWDTVYQQTLQTFKKELKLQGLNLKKFLED